MGVGEWFGDFCKNLVINDPSISTRYKRITWRLNQEYYNSTSETLHSLYVGSYGRNTATCSTSDFDILFQLPYETYVKFNSYSSNGQSALLQEVKLKIEKTYPRTRLKADGQIITISFEDGLEFELLPAFINKDGSYTYPNSNNGGSWKITDPKSEQNAISEMNAKCNKNLIQLCRITRAWKKKHSVPISGMLIDTLAYNFISTWEYRDKSYFYYDYMSRDFFKYLADRDRNQSYWYAPGSNRQVSNSGNFQSKAQKAYDTSLDAIKSASNGYEYTAKSEWRDIYGTDFPN